MMSQEEILIKNALRKYKEIYPCGYKKSLNECITRNKQKIFLWFNTRDGSTHVEEAPLEGRKSDMARTASVEKV
ncbi:MAG: hypothetical protein GF398_00790 [Chitinivibrionales bacterium]|nr:hypothetical protein [Chitinivibrionales bacterium]